MHEDLFDYENRLRFFKINRMLLDFTNPDRNNNADRLRIGVSHAPILIAGGPLLRAIISDIDPHVIFSAHWHESRIFYYPSTKVLNFYENEVREFNLHALKHERTFLEIMVPTASYRMGKTNIGMGYAVLGKCLTFPSICNWIFSFFLFIADNYDLKYTVLWSPSRFVFLLLYVFWFLFAMCIFLVFRMMTRCPFRVAKRQQLQYQRISPIPQF